MRVPAVVLVALLARAGTAAGRIYSIVVTCTNSAGSATQTVTVTVPHDQGK